MIAQNPFYGQRPLPVSFAAAVVKPPLLQIHAGASSAQESYHTAFSGSPLLPLDALRFTRVPFKLSAGSGELSSAPPPSRGGNYEVTFNLKLTQMVAVPGEALPGVAHGGMLFGAMKGGMRMNQLQVRRWFLDPKGHACCN
jgi:hypothetical protein